jgi:predicted transcriptional regulator
VKPFAGIDSVENDLIEHKYLVIKDGEKFVGLLTPSDVVRNFHYLAVDCYTKKPAICEDESIDAVVAKMLECKQAVLPVFSKEKEYIGSVMYETILKEICTLMRSNVEISVTNIIGNNDIETVKQNFLAEMFHNTKNPIQVIYSSINILKDNTSKKEQEILINSILTSTKQIDILINKLFQAYFNL